MNIKADKQGAQGHCKSLNKIPTPGHKISLTIAENIITTAYDAEIRRAYTSITMRHFLHKKHHIKNDVIDYIDFDAIASTLKTLPLHMQIRQTKFIHNWLPTLHNLNKQSAETWLCNCRQPETHHHIALCPLRQNITTDFITNMKKQMKEEHTKIELNDLIIYIVTHGYQTPYKFPIKNEHTPLLKKAYTEQQHIGLENIWERYDYTNIWRLSRHYLQNS